MSGQTGKWREEQILIICPGSQTTMAQLGCSELTPPARRFPTRMFKDEDSEDWRPYYTYKRKKEGVNGAGAKESDEWEYVEDVDAVEGAVYPIQAGRIVNMEAFLAFLEHVHSSLTTTYHNTPIVLMASPQWTRPDCEMIARYVFEKTKTPALCLIHSGIATQYGLKWPNMTVVDVGFEKVDVTCLFDSRVVSHTDIGSYPEDAREISGGEVFTRKLMQLLEGQKFDYEMAEQLKKSPICEVLPYAPESEKLMELPEDTGAPAVAGSGPADAPKIVEPSRSFAAGVDDDLGDENKLVDDEGILDVANIVSGNTREFLAKQEKLKAEKAKAGRKGKDKETAEAAAARVQRLPNSKRSRNVFHYEELVTEEVPIAPAPKPAQNGAPKDVEMGDTPADGAAPATENGAATESAPKPEGDAQQPPAVEGGATGAEAQPAAEAAPAEPAAQLTERVTKRVRRDIEIGLERFLFADRHEIDRIAEAIYRAVQGIEDMYMRPGCWENIVFVGNGSRIRGLKENILQTLQARHLISPSSATMFTSELPSNLGTPSGTGSQTPTGSFTGAPHQLPTASSVNPLLQAATTANLGIPGGVGGPGTNIAGSNAGDAPGHSHHFHSQTPTNIKLAALPTYLSEWTKNGFEEAMFLGSQVAARLAFCIHNLDAQGVEAQRMMSLSRVDYNDLGPKGIRSHSMLG
ncbi:actin-like protein ARP9 [Podospora aff. communis PSN243]|uniref:Actin-like protein ARP9 n=1 Tax=Podospora aff. communis PSN243 TaxID=3040156 RepID=A0AAV9GP74_9PEZI|nr:actin-like protein ARP9 [Podospora aff. communis PSN243]